MDLEILKKLSLFPSDHILDKIFSSLSIIELYYLHKSLNSFYSSKISHFLKKLINQEKRIRSTKKEGNYVSKGHYRDYFSIALLEKVSYDSIHKLLLCCSVNNSTTSYCFHNLDGKHSNRPFDIQFEDEGFQTQTQSKTSKSLPLSLKIIKFLLDHGANINIQTSKKTPSYANGWSALHFAIFYNYFQLIDLLLGYMKIEDSDSVSDFNVKDLIDIKNNNGDNALSLLSNLKKDDQNILLIFQILEKHQVFFGLKRIGRFQENYWILLKAISNNNRALVRKFCELGMEIDDDDGDSPGEPNNSNNSTATTTALLHCIKIDKFHSQPMAKILLSFGANINFANDQGSILYQAILGGNESLIKFCVENGADVNYVSRQGETFGLSCLDFARLIGIEL